MHILNETATPLLLLAAALASAALGMGGLLRNPGRHTHRVYALLAADVGVWALAAAVALWSGSFVVARVAVGAGCVTAAVFPAVFYDFCARLSSERFSGYRIVRVGLYVTGALLAATAFTPFFIARVTAFGNGAPIVAYGPAYPVFVVLLLLSVVFSFQTLWQKRRESGGIRRRQVDHVILGLTGTGLLATFSSVLGLVWPVGAVEVYAPLLLVFLLAVACYALVQYHLPDIWFIFSRTTLYLILTLFVMATFGGSVALVHWGIRSGGPTADAVSTGLAALVIVLVLHPLQERVRLVLDRTLLKRRYDVQALLQRISGYATRFLQADELLSRVCEDIQHTLGVRLVRVVLESEKAPGTVITEYSTRRGEKKTRSISFDFLLEYLRAHPEPIVLERLLYSAPEPEKMRIAHGLAELDAHLCVPLRTSTGVIGMLLLGHKSTHDIYTAEDLRVFSTLAVPLGSAIESARLYRRLEAVNLHLERIMANMRGGVVAVDETGVIKTVNQGAREILGHIAPGQPVEMLRAPLRELLRKALDTGRAMDEWETVIAGADGEDIPVLISTTPLFTRQGEPLGAMGLLFNLTHIKRLEANVQRADRLSSLGTVAAGMAHEIKNPLVSIKTFTQLLPARYDDREFRDAFNDIVPNEVERINTIVTRLLDFARPKPIKFEPRLLEGILERTLMLVENQLSKTDIHVTTTFPETARPVSGDEQQLHQVFLNLLLNAIDALKDAEDARNLHVSLTYERVHLRPKRSLPQLDVPCAKVSVSDTGCGIPSDVIEQVFTPFFTTKSHGSGLGLAVVHGIVTNHGGEIDVSSIPGVGTLFCVTLPLARAEDEAPVT
ncbi:MAG: ATP-binding protein [Candidatus Hydrogenedentota bacterium]